MSYEIAIFEYSDLYNGNADVPADKVLETFITHYTHYFSPDRVEEGAVCLQRGRTWLSYSDRSGADKPKTLMLMGPMTDELAARLKEAVAKVYVMTCEDCGEEFKDRKWAVCKTCRDK